MAPRPSVGALLVQPTGDNDETERGVLLVVGNTDPDSKVMRGVVVAVGGQVQADVKQGDLAYYQEHGYKTLLGHHLVPEQFLLGWEDDGEDDGG